MPAPIVDNQMRAYYHQRAAEYDDWWLGTGLFAGRDRPGWSAEVAELTALLGALPPCRVLDVACGTGFLTQHLQGEVVAIDQSSAMVEVASARLPHARVRQADAVPLPFAEREFDRVVASHFYGHLLPGERTAFVAEAYRVAPQLIVVDSARRPDTPEEEWQERRLNDGTRHQVYKRFFSAHALAGELGVLRTLESSPGGEHPGVLRTLESSPGGEHRAGGEILHDGAWFVAVAN